MLVGGYIYVYSCVVVCVVMNVYIQLSTSGEVVPVSVTNTVNYIIDICIA